MDCAKNESLIKNYTYYKTLDGQEESVCLTNRRIVAESKDKYGVSRTEIRVQDVKTVDTGYRKSEKVNPLGIAMIIAGIVCFFLSMVLFLVADASGDTNETFIISILLMVLCLALLIGGVFVMIKFRRMVTEFFLNIYTDVQQGKCVTLTASTGVVTKNKKAKVSLLTICKRLLFNMKIKTEIDESMIKAMQEELGMLIMDLQAENDTKQICDNVVCE